MKIDFYDDRVKEEKKQTCGVVVVVVFLIRFMIKFNIVCVPGQIRRP